MKSIEGGMGHRGCLPPGHGTLVIRLDSAIGQREKRRWGAEGGEEHMPVRDPFHEPLQQPPFDSPPPPSAGEAPDKKRSEWGSEQCPFIAIDTCFFVLAAILSLSLPTLSLS